MDTQNTPRDLSRSCSKVDRQVYRSTHQFHVLNPKLSAHGLKFLSLKSFFLNPILITVFKERKYDFQMMFVGLVNPILLEKGLRLLQLGLIPVIYSRL